MADPSMPTEREARELAHFEEQECTSMDRALSNRPGGRMRPRLFKKGWLERMWGSPGAYYYWLTADGEMALGHYRAAHGPLALRAIDQQEGGSDG